MFESVYLSVYVHVNDECVCVCVCVYVCEYVCACVLASERVFAFVWCYTLAMCIDGSSRLESLKQFLYVPAS